MKCKSKRASAVTLCDAAPAAAEPGFFSRMFGSARRSKERVESDEDECMEEAYMEESMVYRSTSLESLGGPPSAAAAPVEYRASTMNCLEEAEISDEQVYRMMSKASHT